MPSFLPVTLRDIARRLDVSHTTVSRALRNHPSIPLATCQKIQALAEEMGYRRNALVSTLTNQLRMSRVIPYQATLAFVTALPGRDDWRQGPANLRFYKGAEDRAHHLGYELEEFWVREPGLSAARAAKILLHRGIRGLLIAPLASPLGHLSLNWALFAAATLGYTMAAPHLHSARNHHYHAISLALRKLKQYNYRRIGLALMPLSDGYSDGIFSARYLHHLHFAAYSHAPMIFCERSRASDFTEANFQKWFMHERPDAIICMGHQIHEWVERMGLRVPDEVGVVDLDVHESHCSWSGIDMREEAVAAAGVDLIVQQLQCNDLGIPSAPKAILIEGQWVEGKTLLPQGTP